LRESYMGKFNIKEFNKSQRTFRAIIITVVIFILFIIGSPRVFLASNIYNAVFTSVPITILLATSVVFVIAAGEIDLSFGSTMGFGALIFALIETYTKNPYLALLGCIGSGVIIGFINGLLVSKVKLPSLISTLGMMFAVRGLILVITSGKQFPLLFMKNDVFSKIFIGTIKKFPVQMIWALLWTVIMWFIFSRFKFGFHIRFIGDNRLSAKEMGINVDKTLISSYILVGFAASIAGMLSCLINRTFFTTTGDGYLLIVLVAVFLGGTPTWGGIGTIIGAFLGSLIIDFLNGGIIAAGFSGYYTQLIYGLILIIAIISHRQGSQKYKV
jgi:ribose/xylose/arabinose/galactoside ABC-type transport system permease subunit